MSQNIGFPPKAAINPGRSVLNLRGVAPAKEGGIIFYFDSFGLQRNSQSWRDYEKGKKMLYCMNLTSDEYLEGIRALTEYLNL